MADADKKPKPGTTPPKKGKGRTLEESLAMIRGDFSTGKKAY